MSDKLVLEGFLFTQDEGAHPPSMILHDTGKFPSEPWNSTYIVDEVVAAFPDPGKSQRFSHRSHGKIRITVERIE